MKKGQSLVEMLVIIGIVIILATGIIAGTSVALSRTQGNQVRSRALGFAQEGIELTRQKRDEGWTAFEAMGGESAVSYCVGDEGDFVLTVTSTCDSLNIQSFYTRLIKLTLLNSGDPENEKMSVDVYVSWNSSTPENNIVTLQTYLTQWR